MTYSEIEATVKEVLAKQLTMDRIITTTRDMFGVLIYKELAAVADTIVAVANIVRGLGLLRPAF